MLRVLLSGVEYWETVDPATASTTKQCAPDGEDKTCSDSIPVLESILTTPAHLMVCRISMFSLYFW
jgi:hypothetical protein